MAELIAANLEVARLLALVDQQGIEINRLADIQTRPLTANVETLSDLLPQPFSGINDKIDCKDFFQRYVSWISFQIIKMFQIQTLYCLFTKFIHIILL